MNDNDSPMTDEETLELLLDDWEEAQDRGSDPAPEIICQEFPHLLNEFIIKKNLIAKIDGNLEDAEAVAKPSRKRVGNEPPPSENLDWKSNIGKLDYHAHGGLGIVFRGFDQQLHRDVAIKFIRERRRHNPMDVQRFRVEAEITSRLDHPGIAPVHGYGVTETGVPFYAMRMVEGRTLQQRIEAFHSNVKKEPHGSEQAKEFRKLLSAFISVCNTIEYAHNRGVVNCDIKPGNIMLGKYGETVVLDWGCAKYVGSAGKAQSVGEESLKPLSDTGGSEQFGSTGGTPIYMSPEQHAQAENIQPSSDIYGLGVTLYRIITGKAAFSPEQSLPKIRELVIRGVYRKPTNRCPWISKALEAICLKAMSLSPEDRYANALELASDLESYMADEEVNAYAEPFSRRLARLMRRHRGVSQVLMMSVGAIILLSSISALMMRNLAINETEAKVQAQQMRDRSLQLAARSAATSMALKINDAWRILEIESSGEIIREAMAVHQKKPEENSNQLIQDWLTDKSKSHQRATQAASWFICDAKGKQIARYPYYQNEQEQDEQKKVVYSSIGKNYAHRDYFNGNGFDLKKGENRVLSHIADIHLSAVYQSSNTTNLKVAFSIPIWSKHENRGERKFLGIVGYSVELGQFAVLQDVRESESFHQRSVLVDLRNHGMEFGRSQYGLILQHPLLEDLLKTENPGIENLPRVSKTQMKRIEDFRIKRVKQIRSAGFAASTGDVLLLQDYEDSFEAEGSRSSTAACEPVCVVGRSEKVFDTGWLVIVEELTSTLSPVADK